VHIPAACSKSANSPDRTRKPMRFGRCLMVMLVVAISLVDLNLRGNQGFA
jgi:hypothetical protein